MDCVELRKNLMLYVDNELSLEETRTIRQHLDSCPGCQNRADYEERFQAMLRERLSPLPAPPGLRDRIRARLAEEDQARIPAWRKIWSGFRIHPPALAAALAAVLALSVAVPFLTSHMPSLTGEGGIEALFRGHLVCLQCEKAGVALDRQKDCRTFGHQIGLKTRGGQLLSLADTASAAPLLSNPSLRGREVEVEGVYYRKISTLEVHRHTLHGPGAS